MRALVIFCLVAGTAWSQTASARVAGRITDGTGAVIPGVAVTITNLGTNQGQSVTSGESGDFTILYLTPGRYELEAKSEGFRTHKQAAFSLALDQGLRLDIRMEVGSTAESVTVTEAPPVLNTDNGTRGQTITAAEIAEIPLDGRNFADLALLTGGVIPKGDGGDGSFAVNGGRADNTGFVLDGMNNTQRRNTGAVINPPIEGIQEFKMITSGFAAEYGRYAGGVLTAVTKSGSNKFRGSLYEFLRNDALDATGYFDVRKAKLRRNQFGATVTGPLRIPKLYNGKNRTFFLFTWESLRLVDGKTQRGIVPDPAMLRGDFTRAADAFGRPLRITDPLARAPFPNNQIPLSRLDPVALKLAAYFPAPNLIGPNNFIAQGNGTSSYNNFGIKVDQAFTPKDRVTFSTFWRPNRVFDPVVNGRSPLSVFGLSNQTLDLLSYVRYLRSVTPTMFLEVSANFSRKTNAQVWPLSGEQDWGAASGFLGGTTNPVARGLPQIDASGYISLGPAYDVPKLWSFNNYQYAGTMTWVKGKHNVKFGGDFLRMQYFSRSFGDTRGRVTFLGRFTGEPMADLVLGFPQSTRRQLDAAGPYHLISNYSGFVQDDFKVSSNLTLNFGLRYELMKPPREKFGAWSMFVPSLGKIVIAGKGLINDFDQRIQATGLSQYITMAANVGLPATLRKTDYTDFAPRFGFAWRLFGRPNSVVRGGYGIFYGSSSLYRMDEYSDTYPFSINETYNAVSTNPLALTLSDPFPTSRRNVGGVTTTNGQDSNIQSQYLQSWNLTLEHEVAKDSVIEVAYAGSKGTHLQRRYDFNQQIRDLDYRAANGVFPRPFPAFGSINIIGDGSNSIYNSGLVTIRRRFNRQLFVRATYTFAKSIDESSNTGGTIQYNFGNAQDAKNLKGERGRSDFDIGHSFAASFIWSPMLSRHLVLRDWQVAGTTTMYTGVPFTPKVANFNFANGEASRPDRIGKGTLPEPSVDQWFDRRVFPLVPLNSFRFGSSGRNILDGPGTFNLNASVSRRFRFQDNRALQFRMESFNLPNHPNFNLPENRVDIISGGTISRAKNNRTMQVALRFEF
ncbi:MAG: carboxypeptidase regulatory-like domain-containing protein [Bryobacteraceae bacterium]|nr:carboxypeptidase regulatory-like domain-containing protein [Bryobacteraceae bacterium]